MNSWKQLGSVVHRAVYKSKKAIGVEINSPSEVTLFNFKRKTSEISSWISSSDETYGGSSKCTFQEQNGIAVFSGNVSRKLMPKDIGVIHSGFCSSRSFIPADLPLNDQKALTMSIKGDGRVYRVNVTTIGWNPHEIYMGFLRIPANKWVKVELPFDNFMVTQKGDLLDDQSNKLDPGLLKTIGFTIADEKEGPFELSIEWIKTIRDITPDSVFRESAIKRKKEEALDDNDDLNEAEELDKK